MKGLDEKKAKAIEKLISNSFDEIAMSFLGLVPRISKDKRITFSTSKNSLTKLFLKALGSKDPNKKEEDILKTTLRIASMYIDALKSRTQARVLQDINAYITNKSLEDKGVKISEIKKIYEKEMDKAQKHFKLIANSESNKVTNTGTALQISKVGSSNNEKDPTVFFIVTIDDVTGPEEFRLHLLPDRKTPRVWKLSEIGGSYHKKGEPNPKLPGLHPNCRCKITYLANGFGFNENGNVTYKGKDWNELEYQRKKYEMPKNLKK